MANYEATKYNFTGGSLTGIDLVNTGLIIPWSEASVPSGFLECNGQLVSRTTYSALFTVIGTTYGAGDGSTTFGLPDIQDNVPVGKSPTKALASTGGANTVASSGNISGNSSNATVPSNLLPSHSHPGNGRRANHRSSTNPGGGSPRFPNATSNSGNKGSTGAHSHGLSANFTGNATSVLQPYITVIYIIKT